MPSAALLANGDMDYITFEPKIRSCDFVIAVDGGLLSCRKMGIIPNLILGDFDSVPPEILETYPGIEKIRYSKDKDKSDLELAVEFAIAQGFYPLKMFGGFGKRIDHSFYNLQLLQRYKNHLVFENMNERLFSIEKSQILSCTCGQTLSFLTLSEKVTGCTTEGLKWELQNATLDPCTMSLSNIALKTKVKIEIATGTLICVEQLVI